MYNVKTPALPTAVGKEARIISKLQQVVDAAVRKGQISTGSLGYPGC
jgi:polyhydroxyalkanoate synthesis regulator phasin